MIIELAPDLLKLGWRRKPVREMYHEKLTTLLQQAYNNTLPRFLLSVKVDTQASVQNVKDRTIKRYDFI